MRVTARAKLYEQMKTDMAKEVAGLLGDGFIDAYYDQLASGFVQIAERYAAKTRAVRRRRKKPTVTVQPRHSTYGIQMGND